MPHCSGMSVKAYAMSHPGSHINFFTDSITAFLHFIHFGFWDFEVLIFWPEGAVDVDFNFAKYVQNKANSPSQILETSSMKIIYF